jgi:hypothetical protein
MSPAASEPATSLGIDFGSSFTTAAIRTGPGSPSVIQLEDGRPIASAVALSADADLVVGQLAFSEAVLRPDSCEPSPKRQLGRQVDTLILGGRPVQVLDAVAAVLKPAWAEACRQLNGAPPDVVRLTHPASWEPELASQLEDAARRAGITSPVELLPEPVAAAMHFASKRNGQVRPGSNVAVYDLGGGTFDVAILCRTEGGFRVLGYPLGLPDVGGIEMDERLARHVVEQVVERRPELAADLAIPSDLKWRRAHRALKEQSRIVKELLSRVETVHMDLPDAIGLEPIPVTRTELEGLIHTAIARSLDEVDAALATAGVRPQELSALYLVGGSSRIPVVAQAVRERFGRADTEDDPQSVVALGAAIAGRPAEAELERLRPRVAPPGGEPLDPPPADPEGLLKEFLTTVLVERDLTALDRICSPALRDRFSPAGGGLPGFRARAERLLLAYPSMSVAVDSIGVAAGRVWGRLSVGVRSGPVTTHGITSELSAVIQEGRIVEVGPTERKASGLKAILGAPEQPLGRRQFPARLLHDRDEPVPGKLVYDHGALAFAAPSIAAELAADEIAAASTFPPLDLGLETRRALLGDDYARWLDYLRNPAIAMASDRAPRELRLLEVLGAAGGLRLGMRARDARRIAVDLRSRSRVLGLPLVVEAPAPGAAPAGRAPADAGGPGRPEPRASGEGGGAASSDPTRFAAEFVAAIRHLAELRRRGDLTDEEFARAKRELLDRRGLDAP